MSRADAAQYGLIYHSSFIGRAGPKYKGRISRFLANKCSIAARIDCYTDTPTAKFGEALRQQVEERLNFFETGEPPAKNADAMRKVFEQLALDVDEDEDEASDDEDGMDVDGKAKAKSKSKSKEKKNTKSSQYSTVDKEGEK